MISVIVVFAVYMLGARVAYIIADHFDNPYGDDDDVIFYTVSWPIIAAFFILISPAILGSFLAKAFIGKK